MLDTQTKDQLKQKFQQLKPQLKQAFPDVGEQELSKGQSDPDQLVSTLAEKSGQPKEQIEQQLKQMVSNA